jgi:hypothetical protein
MSLAKTKAIAINSLHVSSPTKPARLIEGLLGNSLLCGCSVRLMAMLNFKNRNPNMARKEPGGRDGKRKLGGRFKK